MVFVYFVTFKLFCLDFFKFSGIGNIGLLNSRELGGNGIIFGEKGATPVCLNSYEFVFLRFLGIWENRRSRVGMGIWEVGG